MKFTFLDYNNMFYQRKIEVDEKVADKYRVRPAVFKKIDFKQGKGDSVVIKYGPKVNVLQTMPFSGLTVYPRN